MLRDVLSGLTLAAVTGVLYAIWMQFGPLTWKLGGAGFDLLLVVGVMLSAMAFFVDVLGARLDQRLHTEMAKADERNRLFDEVRSARALRLNTDAIERRDFIAAPNTVVREPEKAEGLPFPVRPEHVPAAALL